MPNLSNDAEAKLRRAISSFWADPLGYVMFVFPWDDPESGLQVVKLPERYRERYGCEYGPDLWACEFLEDLGREIRKRKFDGKSAVNPIQFATASGHGIGKALRNSELVPTPGGWRLVSEIRPGDMLFGEHGQTVRVSAIRLFKHIPIYRVTFSDGTSVDVSSGHMWSVRGRQERRNGLSSWRTMSTLDIVDAGVLRPNGAALARQWEIPQQAAVQYPERKLKVHPYVYGAWLGDGDKHSGRITNVDREVWDHIEDNYELAKEGKTRTCYGLKADLKAAGLFGCTTYNASVSEEYKQSSDRLYVLQGLLDTDGWVEACGSAAFASASRQLAVDVAEIARSLGLRVSEPKFKANDKAGSWGVHITWDGKTQLFRLTRKQEKLVFAEDRYQKRWIDSIEPVGLDDATCFEVEGSLFLCSGFQVTHNSTLTAWLIKFVMDTRPGSKGTVTANTDTQLRTKTWAELGKWHNRSLTRHWFTYSSARGNMSLRSKEAPDEWFCTAQTCREENSESFAGQHAPTATSFYIFDEAGGIPNKIYEVREGGLTDGEPMVFDFGNPTRNTGAFFENCVGRRKHQYNVRCIDSRTVQITNKEQIRKWAQDWGGEDSDFFRVRVRGMFPSQGSSQFIPHDVVANAIDRPSPEQNTLAAYPIVLGVDCARMGDDESVIYPRIGPDARTFEPRRVRGLDTVQLTNAIIAYYNDFVKLGKRPAMIFVDQGNFGVAIVDNLRTLGYPVTGIDFGSSKCDDPITYRYIGDEIWGKMRIAIRDYLVLPDMGIIKTDLQVQLTQREYGFNNSRIHLENKKDMKERLGADVASSPDIADALACTFFQDVHVVPDAVEYPQGRGVQHEYDPLRVKW